MIIGLCGRKGSGKDTAGDYLVSKYGFEKISFAAKLKESAAALFAFDARLWDQFKNDPLAVVEVSCPTGCYSSITVREFLQRYGTEAHRDVFGSEFWVNEAMRNLSKNKNYVFTDVRFDNEASAILEQWNQQARIVVEVQRKSLNDQDAHASEVGVSPDLITGVLTNNSSIETLHDLIDAVLVGYGPYLHN